MGDKAHFALLAIERDEAGHDQINRVFVPQVHRHDPPPTCERERQSRALLARPMQGARMMRRDAKGQTHLLVVSGTHGGPSTEDAIASRCIAEVQHRTGSVLRVAERGTGKDC